MVNKQENRAAFTRHPYRRPVIGYVGGRASSLFRPVLDHLRETGEARSCIEIDDHFKRNFGIEGVTLACEYLADQKIIGKVSIGTHLTRKSNIEVQQLAFFYIGKS